MISIYMNNNNIISKFLLKQKEKKWYEIIVDLLIIKLKLNNKFVLKINILLDKKKLKAETFSHFLININMNVSHFHFFNFSCLLNLFIICFCDLGEIFFLILFEKILYFSK
jgi:hypothetical protein